MAATIKIKNSSTANAKPTSSDLVQGELALNVTDKKIFTEDSGGNIVELGANFNGFKNRIINGAMTIAQYATSASTSTNSFVLDRWKLQFSGGGVATVQQSSTVPSSTTFASSALLTVTTPDSSLAAGDYYGIVQYIEGYNVADLGFGTSAATSVTLSFWVRSSVTGTYSVAFSNQDGATRTYVATYTINSANTWEQKTITIAGDTTGTWNKTNSNGLRVWFALGMGSTYETSNPNAWEATAAIQSTSSVDWIATNGATFYITGVQLEKGSTATSFDYRPYTTELQLCQRYAYPIRSGLSGFGNGTTVADVAVTFPVEMRSVPSVTQGTLLYTAYGATSAYTQSSNLNSLPTSYTQNGCTLRFSNFTGLTANSAYIVVPNATTSVVTTYACILTSEL